MQDLFLSNTLLKRLSPALFSTYVLEVHTRKSTFFSIPLSWSCGAVVWPCLATAGIQWKTKDREVRGSQQFVGVTRPPWDWSFAAGTATHMPKCGSQPTWMILIQGARLDCMEWSCSKPHLQLVLDQCLSKSDGCGFEINIFWQILKPPMTSTNQTADVSDFLACWIRWPDWNWWADAA